MRYGSRSQVTHRRRSALRLVAGVGVPISAYLLARSWLHSDAWALAVAEGLPIAWMLGVGARQRRVDPLAAAAAVVLAIALAIALLSGGSALALKLRRAVVSGSVAVACLGSVVVRRPLLPAALALLARTWPRLSPLNLHLDDPIRREKASTLTTILGVTCACDAAAQVGLAVAVSTTTFVSVTGLTRLTVFAFGAIVCAAYLRLWQGSARRRQALRRARPSDHPTPSSDTTAS